MSKIDKYLAALLESTTVNVIIVDILSGINSEQKHRDEIRKAFRQHNWINESGEFNIKRMNVSYTPLTKHGKQYMRYVAVRH